MKMRTKILLGFGITIALLIVVGMVSFIAINASSEGFKQYRDFARDSVLVGQMQASMLMSRMKAKDFNMRGTEKDRKEFYNYFEEMEEFVKESKKEITADKRAPKVQEIDTKVKDYRTGFDRVVELHKIREENYAILVEYGPVLEDLLVRIMDSARVDDDMTAAYVAAQAIRSLLHTRLYVMKFLQDNLKKDAEQVNKEYAEFLKSLTVLDREVQDPERRRLLADIRKDDDIYINAFNEIHKVIIERNDIIENKLDKIGPDVATLTDDVKNSIIEDQDTLGPQLQAQNNLALALIIAASVVALIAAVGMAVYTTVSILRQLGEDPAVIENIARKIALGDLEIDFNAEHSQLQGVYLSVSEMVRALRKKSAVLKEIAAGNLTVNVDKASDDDELGESMLQMTSSLNELLWQVNSAVDQVASGSGQVSQSSQALSQGATEQASSLEEIASSINEISSQSKQNSESATQANSISNAAMTNAEEGNKKMEVLVGAMKKINASSEQINKVVKVIDDIAFQINLLALNANVEAARAGKYGKGFAVVADEVRNLAVKSTDSVKETTEMVQEAIRNIEIGNQAADETASQLSEILSGASKVADIVEEIASASKEQAMGIDQINAGLEQIDQVTQANTASAEESASAAEELAAQAQQLKAMISHFQLKEEGRQMAYLPGNTRFQDEEEDE